MLGQQSAPSWSRDPRPQPQSEVTSPPFHSYLGGGLPLCRASVWQGILGRKRHVVYDEINGMVNAIVNDMPWAAFKRLVAIRINCLSFSHASDIHSSGVMTRGALFTTVADMVLRFSRWWSNVGHNPVISSVQAWLANTHQ